MSSGQSFFIKIAKVISIVFFCLLIIDLIVVHHFPHHLIQKTVDIQSPELLYVKLNEFKNFNGVKVLTLGDSLIFGRTMRDRGDIGWENHTFSSQLEDELKRRYPGKPIMVANFGINGVLPSDLENLIRITLPLKPDLIIFDVTLRSFSRDFQDVSSSREWLNNFSIAQNGEFLTNAPLHDFMVNHWALYRMKDLIQALIFDGQPVNFFTRKRNELNSWLQKKSKSTESEVILLFKARSRYDRIDLAEDNPQKKALERALTKLKDAGQPTIAFYATENPEDLGNLIDKDKFTDLQNQLKDVMLKGGNTFEWIGPLGIYDHSNFLDHVHLNQEGYRRLVAEIVNLVTKKIKDF